MSNSKFNKINQYQLQLKYAQETNNHNLIASLMNWKTVVQQNNDRRSWYIRFQNGDMIWVSKQCLTTLEALKESYLLIIPCLREWQEAYFKLESQSKAELQKLESQSKAELQKLESLSKVELQKLEEETKAELQQLNAKLKTLQNELEQSELVLKKYADLKEKYEAQGKDLKVAKEEADLYKSHLEFLELLRNTPKPPSVKEAN